jgi:hypothetical protein
MIGRIGPIRLAGAIAFFKGGADVPPRNLYDETSGELNAKLDLQPKMLAAEAAYRPQYTSLDLADLQTLLNGTEAGTRDQEYTDYENVPAEYGYANAAQARMGGKRAFLLHPEYQMPVTRHRTIETPAQRGLLDILENDLQPASDRLTGESLSAAAGVGDRGRGDAGAAGGGGVSRQRIRSSRRCWIS